MSQEIYKERSFHEDQIYNSDIENLNYNYDENDIENNQNSKEELNHKYKDLNKFKYENFSHKNKLQNSINTKISDKSTFPNNRNSNNDDIESAYSKFKNFKLESSQTNNVNNKNANYSFHKQKQSKLENEYTPKYYKTINYDFNENDENNGVEDYIKNFDGVSKNLKSEKKYNNTYNVNLTSANNSRQDLNKLTDSNNNLNYLNTQTNNYNAYTIQNTSKSNEESNKLLLQVMEKDKIIFEYSKLLKESERALEKNKKLDSEKEEQIKKQKDEIKELKFRLRNAENLAGKKDEEFEKYKNYTEDKFLSVNREKALFEEKYNDLAKLFESNHSDFQNTVFEYKKMENHLEKLRKQIEEKDVNIKGHEKFIEDLKKEVKVVPNLKKEIIDLENTIKILNNELNEEKSLNDKIIQNTNEAEQKLQTIIAESKQGKELMNNYLKLNYEFENLKKEIEFKDKELVTSNEKYKMLMKENEIFVQHFTKEITDFNCLMENINYAKNSYSTNNLNFTNSNPALMNKYSNNSISSEKFSLKYEILNKNFDALRNKYVENYNQNIMMINKFENSLSEFERFNKEIISERDALLKELTLTQQNYKDSVTRLEDLSEDHDKINENYKNLRENYLKLKNELLELQTKNENLCQETHLFLMNCNDKLKDKFPELNIINTNNSQNNKTKNNEAEILDLNFAEKILFYLETLINDYEKSKLSEKDLIDNKENLESHIKIILEEKDNLADKIEKLLIEKEEEIKKIDYDKNEDLNKQREILYEKISSLTELLEESNLIISSYEKENESLKEKNNKLETNLKLLTQSHIDLENSINGNFVILQKEVEEKEYKFNNILRELEIKDMHIQSIESLLNRKEDEIEKLKETKRLFLNNQIKDQNFNNDNYTNEQNEMVYQQEIHNNEENKDFNNNDFKHIGSPFSNTDFQKIEENERELKRLITGTGINKSSKESNEMNEKINLNFNYNSNNDDFKSSQGTIKVPGRIFSSKKKI